MNDRQFYARCLLALILSNSINFYRTRANIISFYKIQLRELTFSRIVNRSCRLGSQNSELKKITSLLTKLRSRPYLVNWCKGCEFKASKAKVPCAVLTFQLSDVGRP